MLMLLPPSEGKTAPEDGEPVDLAALVYARELDTLRRRVLSKAQPRVRRAPAAPARDVYTGVLFARLGLSELPAEDVLITSGLWGVVRPTDRIPAYKLPVGTRVPKLGAGLATVWRPGLERALAARDVPEELVVDLRSGPYVAMWKPKHAQHLAVNAFRVAPDGSRTVISHNAKVARGDVARAVLRARKTVRTPEDVANAAAAAGFNVELSAGTLSVLE